MRAVSVRSLIYAYHNLDSSGVEDRGILREFSPHDNAIRQAVHLIGHPFEALSIALSRSDFDEVIQAQMDFTREAFNLQRALMRLWSTAKVCQSPFLCEDISVIHAWTLGQIRICPQLQGRASDQAGFPTSADPLPALAGRFPKVSSRFVTPEVLVETWENGEIISNIMEDSAVDGHVAIKGQHVVKIHSIFEIKQLQLVALSAKHESMSLAEPGGSAQVPDLRDTSHPAMVTYVL